MSIRSIWFNSTLSQFTVGLDDLRWREWAIKVTSSVGINLWLCF